MTVAENIKRLRKEKRLTQKQLGNLCEPKISESTIRKYELGLLNPKIETVIKIATALEVSLKELLTSADKRIDLTFLDSMAEVELAIQSLYPKRDKATGEDKKKFLDCATNKNAISTNNDEQQLLTYFRRLNDTGKKEAQKRVAELTEVPRYVEESIEYATRTIANAVQDGHIQFINKPKNEE